MMSRVIVLIMSLALTLPALAAKKQRAVSAKDLASNVTVCQMTAGDTGLIKFRKTGQNSYEQAYETVASACFEKRNKAYIKARKEQPDQDRQIQFVESCVNAIRCI